MFPDLLRHLLRCPMKAMPYFDCLISPSPIVQLLQHDLDGEYNQKCCCRSIQPNEKVKITWFFFFHCRKNGETFMRNQRVCQFFFCHRSKWTGSVTFWCNSLNCFSNRQIHQNCVRKEKEIYWKSGRYVFKYILTCSTSTFRLISTTNQISNEPEKCRRVKHTHLSRKYLLDFLPSWNCMLITFTVVRATFS